MSEPLLLLILFIISFISSFIGNFVSGATTLISVSSMLYLGIPPQLTISTQTFGTLGWRIGGLKQFLRAKMIVWKLVIPLSILGFIGSTIGTHILINTNEELIKKIIGIIIIIFIPLTILNKKLGVEKINISKTKEIIGYILYFIISICTGLFSAGTGIFFLYTYLFFFGLTILELKGTDKIPGIFKDIGAIIVFISTGVYNITYLLVFIPGMFLGSTLGAKYTIKLGNKWLRLFIFISIFLMSIKLLLN